MKELTLTNGNELMLYLFKKGDRYTLSKYRPISLISCVGKVMERIIYKPLFNHLHAYNLIFRNHLEFLLKLSTVYQLIDIFNQICKGNTDKQFTSFVFCDISKAFDIVWHRGLLHKLKQME